jgi:hypothetical protein
MNTKFLVRKSEGKRPLRRSRGGWNDNIKMDHKEVGWDVVDRILLAQSTVKLLVLVNKVINIPVQKNVGNFLSSYTPVSFSRWTPLQ